MSRVIMCFVGRSSIVALFLLHLVSAEKIPGEYDDFVITTEFPTPDNELGSTVLETDDQLTDNGGGYLRTLEMPITIGIICSAMLLICCFCCMRCFIDYDMIKTRNKSYSLKKPTTVVDIARRLKSGGEIEV